jgi:hypothetical protein
MGSLQSAILGFGAFRVLQKAGIAGFETFSVSEIVIVQTTAVATATMPLAAGKAFASDSSVASNHCKVRPPLPRRKSIKGVYFSVTAHDGRHLPAREACARACARVNQQCTA